MRYWKMGFAIVSLSVVASSGCGWFGAAPPSGGVAVVDLDEVANLIGANDEIAQALKVRESGLNTRLKSLQINYVEQFKERKTLYGSEPTEEQTAQLVSIGRRINLDMANAQRHAKGQLSNHRSELILQFRGQVSPIAEEIASQRGLSLVVPKNDGWLLYVDETVDITDEVAAKLKDTWTPIVPAAAGTAQQPQVVTSPAEPPGGVQPAAHHEPAPPSQ